MKAVVVHEYGGPEVLKFEEFRDPAPGQGEVLVRLTATSINPIDVKRRSGVMKTIMPLKFPAILGVDFSGTIVELGSGVEGLAKGDLVCGIGERTYAELSVIKATSVAKIPQGLDVIEAAALPLVTTTGNQLISRGTEIKAGQTVLVAGAAGSVGRSAVFTAKDRGATVIAGVLGKQVEQAKNLGADSVLATDDDKAIANLPELDAVADAVDGKTAESVMGKVKKGGVFASVLGAPQNAKDFPHVKVVSVYATADPKILLHMVRAVMDGKLVIPIGEKLALKDADKGHAIVERGGAGKVLLLAKQN
jgi:NADPH:quinone reductase-like Zn-dependent oxidoreductase